MTTSEVLAEWMVQKQFQNQINIGISVDIDCSFRRDWNVGL